MAVSYVKSVGTNATDVSGATTPITVAAGGVASGDLVTVAFASQGQTITGITDTRGTTYALAREHTAQANVRNSEWYGIVGTALQAGDTITVAHATAAKRVAVADQFTGTAGAATVHDISNSGGGASAAPTASVTNVNANDVMVGYYGRMATYPNASYTQPTGYGALSTNGTTGGSSGGNAGMYGGSKVVAAAASQTYNPTTATSTTWAVIISGFEEAVAAAVSGVLRHRRAHSYLYMR